MTSKRIKTSIFAVLFLLIYTSVWAQIKQVGLTAIENANVLPMDTERILSDYTVLIENDRIVWIGPHAQANIPKAARRIQANGKFLLPGLADMHVHTSEADMPLFLANGVTSIREMNGSPAHLQLRQRIRSGEILGPMLYVSGPLIAGEPQRWRHVLAKAPAAARKLVLEQAQAGYDFIKIYDGLSQETYAEIMHLADSLNIPTVGHIPREVGLLRVLDSNQRSIEHAEQIVYAEFDHDLDTSEIPAVVELFRPHPVWLTPTLAVQEALSRSSSQWYNDRLRASEMAFVDKGIMAWWQSLARLGKHSNDEVPKFLQFQQDLVRNLHVAGVRILAGTDAPNPLMVPGFALHHELQNLVAAGMSHYEALRATTANPAEFLNLAHEFGTVEVGKRADLLLVRQNPLADISNLQQIEGVMLRGQWLPHSQLTEMLEQVVPALE